MKSIDWTKEEARELVRTANPFTILGVLIFAAITDIAKISWRVVAFIFVTILIGILQAIRWCLRPWIKEDDTSSTPNQ